MSRSPHGGRPPEPIHDDAVKARPHVRIPSETMDALKRMAVASRRALNAEMACALEAYLAAHPKLPEPPDVGARHERYRTILPPDLVRELDRRAGMDHREAHLLAAFTWWVR